jgi:hypothetical protein
LLLDKKYEKGGIQQKRHYLEQFYGLKVDACLGVEHAKYFADIKV